MLRELSHKHLGNWSPLLNGNSEHDLGELHSPLLNLSCSNSEARWAELRLKWSTCLNREHKPNAEHLTHTLSLPITVMSSLQSPMYTDSVECYTDLCTSLACKHLIVSKYSSVSINLLIVGLNNIYLFSNPPPPWVDLPPWVQLYDWVKTP